MAKKCLLSPKEAAAVLGVSYRHVKYLIEEADAMPKQSRWRHGKHIIDLSPIGAERRTLRINLRLVCPECAE